MTEDQRHVLQQLVRAVEEERPDAVVIAGDLYDRAVPPTEAVELLDETLYRIVIELDTPVLAISGNHDSPDRISFGTRMMSRRGLHLAGALKADSVPVVLSDEHGEVHFHLVPYADPAMVRHAFGNEDIRTHDDAMKVVTDRIKAGMEPQARHVLVGHAFVTPGGVPEANTSESERPLSIGGAEHVKAEYFGPFHYTALGHLHQAHWVERECVRYAGSPLKYSVSEEHHRKGFFLVELDGAGQASASFRPLHARRDMRRVAAPIREIEQDHEPSGDYVFVTLLDENPVLFPMEKVRSVYPNALHVERRPAAGLLPPEQGDGPGGAKARRDRDPVDLFDAFYREVKGAELSKEKRELFGRVYAEVLQEEGAGR